MNWKTKSGKTLRIDDMSTEHITNTIHYLNKRYGVKDDDPEFYMSVELKEQVHYMQDVLVQRKLDERMRVEIDNADPCNPFVFL